MGLKTIINEYADRIELTPEAASAFFRQKSEKIKNISDIGKFDDLGDNTFLNLNKKYIPNLQDVTRYFKSRDGYILKDKKGRDGAILAPVSQLDIYTQISAYYDILAIDSYSGGNDLLSYSNIIYPSAISKCWDLFANGYNKLVYDDSAISRLNVTIPTYNGNVVTVGTNGDYASISAAYSAVSEGGVINILEDIDTTTEPNGFIYLNAAKNVKIKGDNDTVKVYNNTSTSEVINITNTLKLTIENLGIEGIGTVIIRDNTGYNTSLSEIFIHNCRQVSNGSASKSRIVWAGGSNYPSKVYSINSSFSQVGKGMVVNASNAFSDSVLYYENCVFSNMEASSLQMFSIQTNYAGGVYMYGCTINSYNPNVFAVVIGDDVSIPSLTMSQIDIRECTFNSLNETYAHTVLLGRGTQDVYFLNNTINTKSITNSNDTGLAVKTINSTNTAIIKGNIIKATRPLYIKGGSGLDLQYNTIITESEDSVGVVITNQTEDIELNADDIVFKNNKIKGTTKSLALSSNTTTAITTTLLSWVFDNNTYSYKDDYYASLEGVIYTFEDRVNFWNQDANSSLGSFGDLISIPLPHLCYGIDANGEPVELTVIGGVTEGYDESGSLHLQDYGGVEKADGTIIPNNYDGEALYILVDGDIFIPGSASRMNATPCRLRLFELGQLDDEYKFFNKADALIYPQSVRDSVHYDSANTGDFKVPEEFNQQWNYDNILEPYKYMWWIRERNGLYTDAFLYPTALAGNNICAAKKYVGVGETYTNVEDAVEFCDNDNLE